MPKLKTAIIFSIIFFGVLFFAKDSLAANYYISTSGNDDNPGSQSQPWRTIQKGVNTIVAGDTLYIRGGTYSEAVTISSGGSGGNYKTIQSYSGETAVLDGQNSITRGIDISNGVNYVKIIGLEIRNYKNWGIASWYGHANSYITIQNCDIHDNGGGTSAWPAYEGGITFHGESQTVSNIIIDNNKIHHNYRPGIFMYTAGTGIMNNITISNNIIYRNPKTMLAQSDVYALWIAGLTNSSIHDNYIYFSQKSSRGEQGVQNNIFYNNVFAYSGFSGLDLNDNCTGNTVKNNVFAYNGYHGANPKTNSNNNVYYNNIFYRNNGSGLYGLYTSTGLQSQNNIYEGGCGISAVYNDTAWGTKDYDNYYNISNFGTTEVHLLNSNPLFTDANNFNFSTSLPPPGNTPGDCNKYGLCVNFLDSTKVIPYFEATVNSSSYDAGNPSRTLDHKYTASAAAAWISNSGSGWIIYDLGSAKTIKYTGLLGAGSNGHYSPKDFHIATSDNGTDFTSRLDATYVDTSNDAWSEMVQWFELPSAVSARYVKLTIDNSQKDYSGASNANVSVSEFYILGSLGISSPPDTTPPAAPSGVVVQ